MLHTFHKSETFFLLPLCSTILQEVPTNPYLGINISNDLKWNTHVSSVISKANSSLGLLRRNLHHCPATTRKTAYIALVRSTLEYGATIWDPYTQTEINRLEGVQRRAARFITQDYKSRDPGCVTRMLNDLQLPPLQTRRKHLRLAFMYKIAEGLVPAIPPDSQLKPVRNKRRIRAKKFQDCVSQNFVEQNEINNSKCFIVPSSNTDIYKNSLFPKTIRQWNQLEESIVSATSPDSFKQRLLTQLV